MSKNDRQIKISTRSVFWALLFIAAAVLLLLDAVGVTGRLLPAGLTVWRLLLGGVLLWILIHACVRGKPFEICIALAAQVALFDEFVLRAIGSPKEEIASVWLLLLVALLLGIGIKILQRSFCRLHRGGDFRWTITGSATRYYDCTTPFCGNVENNMGSTLIYFTNPALYRGGSSLHVENNLGSVVIHVPENWQVTANVENNLGSVRADPSAGADPALTLRLCGENNLGSIEVKYVAAVAPATADGQSEPTDAAAEAVDPDDVLPRE